MNDNLHLFIVTAYQDLYSLDRLLIKLSSYGYVFLHLDKKSSLDISTFQKYNHVFVYKKYSINWGSMNHLRAIIFLLRKAREINPQYVHILSGQDYPIVSANNLKLFFAANEGTSYMEYQVAQTKKELVERYQKYWFTDLFCHPKTFDFCADKKIHTLLRIQNKLKIKRARIGEFNESQIYKGLVYVSLFRDAYLYVLDYINEHPEFLRALSTCLIPEEFFFQTILLNSSLKDRIKNDNLRYMDWSFRDGISPCILDERDYCAIISQKVKFFMRKVSSKSDGLINKLGNE